MRFGPTHSRTRPEPVGRRSAYGDLPSGPQPVSTPGSDELRFDTDEAAVAFLDRAIAALDPYLREGIIPSRQVIDPLLDVWSAARSVDPDVARPVEELLTVLISRTTTTPAELVGTLDHVQIAALQARVFTHPECGDPLSLGPDPMEGTSMGRRSDRCRSRPPPRTDSPEPGFTSQARSSL